MHNYVIAMTNRVGSAWFVRLMEANGCLKPREHLTRQDDTPIAVKAQWILDNQPIAIKCNHAQLDRFTPYLGEDFWKCPFIWMRRRSVWRQAISEYVKDATGKAHVLAGEDYRPQAVAFDGERIRQVAQNVVNGTHGWAVWFADRDAKPLTIWYEDLVDDPAREVGRAMRHLQVPERPVKVCIPFRPTAIPAADEWAQRLQETYGDLHPGNQ